MSKDNFLRFANYIVKQVDWEQLEKDEMLEDYCKGMDWFLNKFFNQAQLYLSEMDCQFLRMFVDNNLSYEEIKKYTTYKSVNIQMMKYMRFGLITTKKEKKITYYELTPFGKHTLFNYEDYFSKEQT